MAQANPVTHLSRQAGQLSFGTDAAGYHAGRIGYPEELFDAIFARVGPGPRILEIGPGTGLSTRSLLAREPSELVAVESDPALVDYLRREISDPRLTVVNAPFPDGQVDGVFDLVVCAAAFHWLDPQPALARIHQLLRPGGIWAMWWNAYRNPTYGDPLAQAITAMLGDVALPPSEGRDGHYSLDAALHTEALTSAGFLDVQHQHYRLDRTLTAAEARALYASYSYVRALPERRRGELLDAISNLVDREFGGRAPNVVITTAYSALRGATLPT
ncbi:class I SAM-dependent methyltransferase [Sphingomonas sp. ID1715]|nr:class I SAM-dependent methyltransferase [Sphingomonas sp. ID1715]